MKKLLVLAGMQTAFADGAANIKIRLNGTAGDNRYFICLPNVGCLSVLAAERGKVYPIFQPITLGNIFILDASNHYRLSPQAGTQSCNITVNTGQTVTISGNITKNGQIVRVGQLHCAVS
jgi:hypothetical protein